MRLGHTANAGPRTLQFERALCLVNSTYVYLLLLALRAKLSEVHLVGRKGIDLLRLTRWPTPHSRIVAKKVRP